MAEQIVLSDDDDGAPLLSPFSRIEVDLTGDSDNDDGAHLHSPFSRIGIDLTGDSDDKMAEFLPSKRESADIKSEFEGFQDTKMADGPARLEVNDAIEPQSEFRGISEPQTGAMEISESQTEAVETSKLQFEPMEISGPQAELIEIPGSRSESMEISELRNEAFGSPELQPEAMEISDSQSEVPGEPVQIPKDSPETSVQDPDVLQPTVEDVANPSTLTGSAQENSNRQSLGECQPGEIDMGPPPMDEEALRQAMLNYHATLNVNQPAPRPDENLSGLGGPPSDAEKQHEELSITPTFLHDHTEDDAAAAAAFEKIKQLHESKRKRQENTMIDNIHYRKACLAEEDRIRLRDRHRAACARDRNRDGGFGEGSNGPIFCSDAESSPAPDHSDFPPISPMNDVEIQSPANKRLRPNRSNKLSSKAIEESIQVGIDASAALTKKGRKRGRGPKARVRKPKSTQAKAKGSKKRGRPPKRPQLMNFDSLGHHDIIADATANRNKPEQPGFTATNRKDALTELIASMPEDQRKLYGSDRKALDEACQKFNPRTMHPAGEEGWKLKGMKSCLKNYQLLGAAFMRERENSGSRPHGGIQSDEMGLGKTVMTIANILDGKPSSPSANRTTLIVCPSALARQWMDEIAKHTEEGALDGVMVYRAGARVMATRAEHVLSGMDVVITSYNEVLRSYPFTQAPGHLVSDEAKKEWWIHHYYTNRGPLHKVNFRRIVLDEAQAIKNPLSKTSIAIRGLTGKYRWALSGTPITNSVEEFYPYFAFLKVEHTGDIDTFKRNFCRRGSVISMQRLQVYLSKIMVRRTHTDTLFGAPILKLPDIDIKTTYVEFNDVERTIYRIVKERFLKKILVFAENGSIEKKYQSVFVLLLRLRQLTGHILLIQRTLKEILEAEDIERLWKLTAENNDPTLKMLSRAIEDVQSARASAEEQTEAANVDDARSAAEGATTNPVAGQSLSFRFRRLLRSLRADGNWAKIVERSLCHACGNAPIDPHITDCMHIYCKECLASMHYEAAVISKNDLRCLACDTLYQHAEACTGFHEAAEGGGSPPPTSSPRRRRRSADATEEDADWFTIGGPILQSTKSLAVTAQIEEWLHQDPQAKIIVFTQFLGMIKVMSRVCHERDWGYNTFHGGMPFSARDGAINEFSTDPTKKILLASLRAGGIGLNLTAANRVILVDLFWNAATDQQAICRVFRIGQTRNIEAVRLVVQHTIDVDILELQARKAAEIGQAIDRKPGRLTTDELVHLFNPLLPPPDPHATADDPDPDPDLDPAADDHEAFIFVDDPYHVVDDDSDTEAATRVPARPF